MKRLHLVLIQIQQGDQHNLLALTLIVGLLEQRNRILALQETPARHGTNFIKVVIAQTSLLVAGHPVFLFSPITARIPFSSRLPDYNLNLAESERKWLDRLHLDGLRGLQGTAVNRRPTAGLGLAPVGTLKQNHNNDCFQGSPSMTLRFAFLWLLTGVLTLTSGLHAQEANTSTNDELRRWLKAAVDQAASFEDRFDAEVWLMDMSNRTQRYLSDDQERLYILRAAHREARRAGLPPGLVLAVIHTESRFQRFAISVAGAQGLMQVMPFWKKEIGRPQDNLTDIDTNLRYGCTILAHYLKRANGNISEALARYNGSYGKMKYPNKVYANQSRYQD